MSFFFSLFNSLFHILFLTCLFVLLNLYKLEILVNVSRLTNRFLIHKILSSKMNLSRLEIFNDLINANFRVLRKENTNLSIYSCNLYVISRTHLFCKNFLCEACREKLIICLEILSI